MNVPRHRVLPVLCLLLSLSLPSATAQPEPSDETCCGFVVAGTVFFDVNGDGIMNGFDHGLQGWTVEAVQHSNGQVLATTLTDAGGFYWPRSSTRTRWTGASAGHFGGTMDELEIFRREITPEEVNRIYQADVSGKCREACYASVMAPCCNNGEAGASFTICNYDVVPHLYSWGLTPVGNGPGCAGAGANLFDPPAGTVSVPAGACLTVPVDIMCPTGVPAGQASCFQVSVFNHDTGRLFGCLGSVRRPGWWCRRWKYTNGTSVIGMVSLEAQSTRTLLLHLAHVGVVSTPISAGFTLADPALRRRGHGRDS